MKHFKPIIFTAIALSAFAFPTGCVNQAKKAPPPRRVVAKPVVADSQKELELKLLKAAHGKDLATVKVCVKKGGNVNVQDPSGWSAAMWAVWHWFDDKALCAYIMHSGGAFAQHQKDHLLERAARTGDCARAEFFLGLGANPNYVNAFGENCATLALRYFRGQYGIPENVYALPRYGSLEDINLALKLNFAENDVAGKRFVAVQKALEEYKVRAEAFGKSPQASPSASEEFEEKEFENAQAFYKSAKDESEVPGDLSSASMIYNAMLAEASAARDAAGKNLQYVKFVALLKAKGANLRKLLAGKQDNSGEQDDWEGQQDKWTIDPLARYAVREAFPHVADGLWDGELALIQLIGRGEEIFKGQPRRYTEPVTQEFLAKLYLTDYSRAMAFLGALEGLYQTVVQNALESPTYSWEGSSNSRRFSGNITLQKELSLQDVFVGMAIGASKYQDEAALLATVDFLLSGEKYLAPLNADIAKENAGKRAVYEQIFSLFEEIPLEGELLETWKKRWSRKKTAEAKLREKMCNTMAGSLKAQLSRLEYRLDNVFVDYKSSDSDGGSKKFMKVANGGGNAQDIREESDAMYEEYEKTEATIEKIKKFLASDFFKETPLEELLKNPPHPRDADPAWYAQNCLGKIKSPEVFTNAAKAFLDYGVDVNGRANGTNHPALVCAYLWDKPEFEELLLSYGADKKLALFHICDLNDFDLLKKLLPRIESLAEVPDDARGNSILHRAVLAGRADMIPEIVKRGVAVDVRNDNADTALHLAAEKEDKACVLALLDAGANADARDKDGRKPFQRFWNVPSPELTRIFADAHKK